MSRAPSPQGSDAALEDRVPERDRVLGRAAELAASLARVAGAGDEALHAQDVHALAERERLDLDSEALERLGPLNGEVGPLVGDVVGLGERGVVGLDVRGVDDEQVVVVPAAVGDQVVDDSAPRRS